VFELTLVAMGQFTKYEQRIRPAFVGVPLPFLLLALKLAKRA
jgi:hypothetical protein